MYVIRDGMYIQEDSLIIKLLFLKDSSTLCYSSSLSIFLHRFSDPPPYGGSFTLYRVFQVISIVQLFIIQPCIQVCVLSSILSGSL